MRATGNQPHRVDPKPKVLEPGANCSVDDHLPLGILDHKGRD